VRDERFGVDVPHSLKVPASKVEKQFAEKGKLTCYLQQQFKLSVPQG
jgi:hypothetical protein